MSTAPVQPTPWVLSEGHPLLRRATADDVVALAALKRRVERRSYGHLGTAEALSIRLHRRCTAWYLLGRIAAGDLLLAAEQEGALVGLAGATVHRDVGVPRLHLHSTYVDRPGQGLGTMLTRARLDAADRLGILRVTADCLVGAAEAERRLHRLGLVEVGERSCSTTFPGIWLSHWGASLHTARRNLTPPAAIPRSTRGAEPAYR